MSRPYYLDGKWESSDSLEPVINPWNGRPVDEICLAGSEAVGRAVAAAAKAFEVTRAVMPYERAECLLRIAAGLKARRAEFVQTLIAEAGKPLASAEVEVERAIIGFEQASHETAHAQGQLLELGATRPGRDHFGLTRRFPLGVILGISPFNFPLNLVVHKVAPAIATGNTMLLKPALKTPLSALLLAEVLHEAEVPAGQINVVTFDHAEIPALLSDPRIKMLSFTGSVEVGWKLKGEAAKLKVALELGGNAAVVVEPETDLAVAVPKIAAGAFGYAGQSCISVQRILVHASIYAEFRDRLTAFIMEKVAVGDPSDAATVVGPMISGKARDKVVGWIERARDAGAKLLTPLEIEGGSVLHPVLLENVPADCEVVCEEAFAPLAVLQSYETFQDALRLVNESRFGLQAGIFTTDIRKALQAFDQLEVGGVMINQVPTYRVENMPYGGVKDSGFGREGIRFAMEEMTEPRSLVINGA